MNLRAAQVKIINEYIEQRILALNTQASKTDGLTKCALEIARNELTGVQKCLDYACEFGDAPKEVS